MTNSRCNFTYLYANMQKSIKSVEGVAVITKTVEYIAPKCCTVMQCLTALHYNAISFVGCKLEPENGAQFIVLI